LVLSGKEITTIPSEVFQLTLHKIANLDNKISTLENLKVLENPMRAPAIKIKMPYCLKIPK